MANACPPFAPKSFVRISLQSSTNGVTMDVQNEPQKQDTQLTQDTSASGMCTCITATLGQGKDPF